MFSFMIQVDLNSNARTHVSITDGRRRLKSAHETVHGLTPIEVLEVLRRALKEEARRRIAQQQVA